jgi:hypothetical protein
MRTLDSTDCAKMLRSPQCRQWSECTSSRPLQRQLMRETSIHSTHLPGCSGGDALSNSCSPHPTGHHPTSTAASPAASEAIRGKALSTLPPRQQAPFASSRHQFIHPFTVNLPQSQYLTSLPYQRLLLSYTSSHPPLGGQPTPPPSEGTPPVHYRVSHRSHSLL